MELHGWFEIVGTEDDNKIRIRDRFNRGYTVRIGDSIKIEEYKTFYPCLMYITFEQNPFDFNFEATVNSIVGDKI